MKIALVTTTIHVPEVLRLYRAIGPDVSFFVTGDKQSPHEQIHNLCREIGNAFYQSPAEQLIEKWACSDLIGWNTIARRNIAILEALKWGAEIIVTVDDDNICIAPCYFENFNRLFGPFRFDGISISGYGGWFDPGQLLAPLAQQRGFPMRKISAFQARSITGAKIGVASGAILGDPDLDAVTRLANQHAPIDVRGVSELLRAGTVVEHGTWTITNTQNTAFLRELAPCMLLIPQFGRHDDIFASLVAQRVMRERGLHVHHGQPLCWQSRNSHDLLRDLEAEIFGMTHIERFAAVLDAVTLPGKSVLDDVEWLWGAFAQVDWMPDGVAPLARAWIEDCRRVL